MTKLLKFNLVHKNQSDIRPSHSCEAARIDMVSKWLEKVNKVSLIERVDRGVPHSEFPPPFPHFPPPFPPLSSPIRFFPSPDKILFLFKN